MYSYDLFPLHPNLDTEEVDVLGVTYDWGDRIKNVTRVVFDFTLLYRYIEVVQPSIEFHGLFALQIELVGESNESCFPRYQQLGEFNTTHYFTDAPHDAPARVEEREDQNGDEDFLTHRKPPCMV